jgi:hypothetical protein
MALGSLVDAGADVAQLFRLLEQLPIGGWSLDFEPVMRNGLAATRAVVGTRGDVVVRTFVHIVGVIEEARLPDRVRDRALAAFQALAEVEGRLHRRPVAQVHFHEVGGHDTIVDIVGTAAALEILGVDTVMSSEVATGTGIVRTSHGILPNPAPAVVALLAGIPTAGRDLNIELTTPTGAAILSAWGSRFGPMPGMVVEATGFGAGSREIDGIPNCTQVVVGELTSEGVPYNGQHLLLLEANLDDATGETLAHAIERLMAEGALDAWLTPILMKKGRPAYTLSVLCDTSLAGALCGVMVAETGTLGVRATSAERWAVDRSVGEVTLGGLAIRVKVSPGRVKAEQGDVAKVAGRIGLPGLEVAAQAEAAWRRPTPIGGEPGEGTASVADIGAAREADVGHGTGTGSGSAREPDFGRGPRDGAGGREPDFGRGPRDGAGGRDAPEGDDDLSPPPLGA